ncbi:unnamed protein product [Heterobilharzia americana]|nr:unnamed protein product [Heterobilharzia americana]
MVFDWMSRRVKLSSRRERLITMDPATLRHFKTKTSIKAMGIATIISTLVTGFVCTFMSIRKLHLFGNFTVRTILS